MGWEETWLRRRVIEGSGMAEGWNDTVGEEHPSAHVGRITCDLAQRCDHVPSLRVGERGDRRTHRQLDPGRQPRKAVQPR